MLVAAHAAIGRADQIVTGGVSHVGVKVIGLSEGRLVFRTAQGERRAVGLDKLELLIVDAGGLFADFNQAERYLSQGAARRAVVRYQRAVRPAQDFWPDLIAARLLVAHDRAGHLDRAVAELLRVLDGESTGPAAAARLLPESLAAGPDGRTARALEKLTAALTQETDPAKRSLLELCTYRILQATGDPRAAAAARRVVSLAIPPAARSEKVYAIVLGAMRRAKGRGDPVAELAGVNRAIRDCPDSRLPDFLMLKGDLLSDAATAREEVIRAVWMFLRVPIHFPASPRAGEALYRAAMGLEKMGKRDKAVELLTECLAHAALDRETGQSARAALRRLQG